MRFTTVTHRHNCRIEPIEQEPGKTVLGLVCITCHEVIDWKVLPAAIGCLATAISERRLYWRRPSIPDS